MEIKIGTILVIMLSLMGVLVKGWNFSQGLKFKQIEGEINNYYIFDVEIGVRTLFRFDLNDSELYVNPMRKSVKIVTYLEENPEINFQECPLSVTIILGGVIETFTLPTTKTNPLGIVFKSNEKTLCMEPTTEEQFVLQSQEQNRLTVQMATCSKVPMKFTLNVNLNPDFHLQFHKEVTAEVKPTAPAYYRFTFPVNSSDFAFIQITSESDSCLIMSIQQLSCPVYDKSIYIERFGIWQTVTTKTGMSVSRKKYPNGFYIVFVLLTDDSKCKKSLYGQEDVEEIQKKNEMRARVKNIRILMRDDLPLTIEQAHFALLFPLAFFLSFAAVMFLLHLHFLKMRCHLMMEEDRRSRNEMNVHSTVTSGESWKKSFDFLFLSKIHISEVINSHPERIMIQSKRFCMAGLLVASFYSPPVFRLILIFHKRVVDTGNYDLCYYNYLCSNSFRTFHDFNHLYSNLGYFICGILFIGIVFLRQQTLLSPTDINGVGGSWIRNAPLDISKGVFVHHGLHYAMGLSLLMTGVMSGVYHVCPNENNFQFDTAFMYTTAALAVVTIYQFRHPTYVSANLTFITLAIVATSTVLGLLWGNKTFRIAFTISHFAFLGVVLTYKHYVGYIRKDGVVVTDWKEMFGILNEKWRDDIRYGRVFGFQRDIWISSRENGGKKVIVLPGPCRFVFPLCVIAVNSCALTFIWNFMQDANFAFQVLAVYVFNSCSYAMYYSFMKLLHGECRGKLWVQPCFYLVMSIFLWIYSLTYFLDVVTLWEISPAESRARNAECIFLKFYDTHDVWHFISAAAMFTSLMALLTMDDDLVNRPKSMIPVF